MASFAAPILFFIAFFLFVWGWAAWALIPVIFGVFLLKAFPRESESVDRSEKISQGIVGGLTVVATFLILFWIESIPEWESFSNRVFSREVVQDWRLMSAVFLSTCISGYTNYQKAAVLTDEEILKLFDECSEK